MALMKGNRLGGQGAETFRLAFFSILQTVKGMDFHHDGRSSSLSKRAFFYFSTHFLLLLLLLDTRFFGSLVSHGQRIDDAST